MPETKYPIKLETQYLRLRLEASERRAEAAEGRARRMLWAFAAMLLFLAVVSCGSFCLISAGNNATVLRMTEEHAKAVKAAVNAQARTVKYGNEGR